MKRIRPLSGPVPELAGYRNRAGEAATWEGFRRNRGGAYRELLGALDSRQHGLCAYCEIGLIPEDRQIEHVVPQASPEGKLRRFDPMNLVACCLGGTNPKLAGRPGNGFARFEDPPAQTRSCGQAKGEMAHPGFLDPRELPEAPSVFRVGSNGKIRVHRRACAATGVAPERVHRTIDLLNLNSVRLRRARRARWIALEKVWRAEADNERTLVEAARTELLPDASDRLSAFFTTRRSFFGPLGERVLAEEPRRWV